MDERHTIVQGKGLGLLFRLFLSIYTPLTVVAWAFFVIVASWCPQSTGQGLIGNFKVMEACTPVFGCRMSRGVDWWASGKCAGGNKWYGHY